MPESLSAPRLPDFQKEAHDAHQRALKHAQAVNAHYLALGLELINNDDKRYWEALGWPSFGAYCAAPPESGGLGLMERSRQQCMQVAHRFVVELEVSVARLAQIPKSNLATLVPVANEHNLDDVLTDAEVLANRELRENKRRGKYDGSTEPYNAETELEPNHPGREEWLQCPYCQRKFRT